MNKLWQQLAIGTNWPAIVAVAVLSALGVLSIWADSPDDGLKQLAFVGVGVLVLMLLQVLNYSEMGRWSWGFYIGSLLLLMYTIVPFVHRNGFASVPTRNGAHAWIDFKVMSLQPAELTKIAFVMVLARYLRFRSNYRRLVGLLAPFALALVPVALILKQPDLGTSLVFIPALFAMLFVAGARMWHLAAIVGLGLLVAPVLWFSGAPNVPLLKHLPEVVKPYQRARVHAMFDSDPATMQATRYQGERAMTALGSGGVTGQGLGNIPIGQSVPEGHNDMVFALIGEQFGFIGSAIVLAAYIVLFASGVEIAAANRDPFGRLVALGIVSVLAGQTFINLMVVLRLMPVTGVTLPFVSYGGSSLLASFIAVGLLLNIGQNRPIVMARDSFEFEA